MTTPNASPRIETRKIAPRSAPFEIRSDSWNEEKRTITGVLAVGAMGRRYDWFTDTVYDEELDMSASSVRMGRLESGRAPVLDSHRYYSLSAVMGVVEAARLAEGAIEVDMRFADTEDVADGVRKVATGIVRNMSAGYRVHRYMIIPAASRTDGGTVPLYRAIDWEPHEASMVPIGFDAAAATRSADGKPQTNPDADDSLAERNDCVFEWAAAHIPVTERTAMTTPAATTGGAEPSTTAAPQTPVDADAIKRQAEAGANARAAEILDLCQRADMADKAAEWISAGKGIDEVRKLVFDAKFAKDSAATNGVQRNISPRITTERDEAQTRAAGITEALLHRISPRSPLTDNGRQYRGMSFLEIGRELLESNGVKTRGMSRPELALKILHARSTGMHGTSDFASIGANVATKRLRSAYEETVATYNLWAKQAPSLPDFKPITVAKLGNAPDLLQINEAGEYTYGSMRDGSETYQAVKYGRIVALTFEMIVNDDMRAFDTMVTKFGNAARRLENRVVTGVLTANAALSDGQALFSAATGNRLQANVTTGGGSSLGSAGSPSLSALSAARLAMRVMRGDVVDGSGETLNIIPRYLIVPAALETVAGQITSSGFVPAAQGSINEFAQGGRTALQLIVEPLLDATSTTQWYLAAEPNQVDTVEYAGLEGFDGPQIDSEVGFETDGVSYRVRHFFAAKAIDHRGLHRAAGA